MNLDNLDKIVKSITEKGGYASPERISLESLFFNYGTLTTEQANELLWMKREQMEKKLRRKYPDLDNSIICPVSLCFNSYTNYSKIKL